MKRIWIFALVLLLTGCSVQKDVETIMDGYYEMPLREATDITVFIPEGAETLRGEEGSRIYMCDGFTIQIQNMPSGNLDKTLREVSGFSQEQLQLITREENDHHKIECVWASAGEGEDQIGRAVILDDGVYHYTLTLMCNASQAGDLTAVWQRIAASFSLDTDA